jgi:hypothetical protein
MGRQLIGAKLVSRWCAHVLVFFSIVASVPLSAQETITYSYDALGRLVRVYHGAAGPNANVSANYSYDNADNRTQVVAGSSVTTLTLSPAALPNGTVGTAYPTQTITATGGSGGYSFAVSAATLPAGLTLSSAGLLSGTPTTAATYRFTITATDSSGSTGSRDYSVTIGASNTLTFSPTTVPNGTVGSAYTQTITASGGTSPYTFAVASGLPAGLTLSSGGLLSGTPTTAGQSNFIVQATDSGGSSGSQPYSLTIGVANNLTLSPATLVSGTVGSPYNQTITASGGTSPYAFAVSGNLPAGLTLSSAGVLSGTPTTAGTSSFIVQATDSGANHTGSRSYDLNIGTVQPPVANPDSASTTVCGTVTVNVVANDTDPAGNYPLQLTAIVSSTKGTATIVSSTSIEYDAFGQTGNGVVTYTVANSQGATANGTLSVNISGGICQ